MLLEGAASDHHRSRGYSRPDAADQEAPEDGSRKKRMTRMATKSRWTKEVAAPCSGCRKPLWLSVEGFRCLRCPRVHCRKCAAGHFSEINHLVTAVLARQALRGGRGLTIHFCVPPPRDWEIMAERMAKVRLVEVDKLVCRLFVKQKKDEERRRSRTRA